jgi:hypothetical protein
VVTGKLKVQSGEARNEASAAANLVVQPGLWGGAQTVTTSFASTNNTSPRFGVLLRYTDAKNYYVCSRQVGGSSLVQIAKVENGVEKVLKSAAVPNPVVNVFSTLSCQASGNTLILGLNGVTKVSIADPTFSAGSVGYTILSRMPASHRADNFSAVVQ